MSQCVICTRDHKDSLACTLCVDSLVKDLQTLAWLSTELIVTRTRQARIGGGGRAAGAPLGFHAGAADAYDQLHRDLTAEANAWLRSMPNPMWPDALPVAALARWFAAHPKQLRDYPGVDRLRSKVDRHTQRALEVINPERNESTFGVCGAEIGTESCTAYLYGEPDAGWVRCKRCKTQHNTYERKKLLEARMRALYFRASTLARLLPLVLERPVSASNIRNWAAEGKPIKTKLDEQEHRTFHCGDTIAVASSVPKRDRKAKVAS